MSDADFWRDLAARFRALPNDYGTFCIDWKQLASGVRIWIPRGTPSTMAQFDSVAARGGMAIDPSGSDPRETWLQALVGTSPTANLISPTGKDEPPCEGKIKNPCGASADFCNALELRALQSGARKTPRRRSLVRRATEQIESVLRRHAPETTGSQIRKLRDECRWTIEDLADAAKIHERTISRHEADEIQPYARTLHTYERIFSKQLNRKIVINKMP